MIYLFYYFGTIIIDYNVNKIGTQPELFNAGRIKMFKNLLPLFFLIVVITCINYWLQIVQKGFLNVVL